MPSRMSDAIFAAHVDNVLKLAQREGGVSRPQIISELNVSRTVASSLIEKAGLTKAKRREGQGRTDYFVANGTAEPEPTATKQSRPDLPPVKAVAVPASADTGLEPEDVSVADLDAEIIDTRNTLREAAAKAGKALGEWATHQALVDSLRERLTTLATKRMNVSS